MKRGFTILELLVVMTIIVLLSTLAITSFTSIQAKSRDTRRMEDIREIQKALSLYYVSTNNYPTGSAVALNGSDVITTTLQNEGSLKGFSGDPRNGYEYIYNATTSAGYQITFCLETDSIPNYTLGCSNVIRP